MTCIRRPVAAALPLALLLALPVHAQQALPEVTVTGTREGERLSETPRSVTVVGADAIRAVGPAHPSEIMNRVPGVTVLPTTGEGHTTGIRQPISTSPVYLFLEDGVPTRSTGFFNHNALYEVNLPQAGGVEVIRGPGSALHGSDAIGGVVNVLTRAPALKPEAEVTVEGGTWGWYRGLGSASTTWGDTGVRADLNLTHSDGWRDSTAYDRQSATLRLDHVLSDDATLKTVFAATNIDQQTGANSRLSLGDYTHNPTLNYTPIAFRKVQALRLSSTYEREKGNTQLSLIPYARWNRMELLPSWQLAYDPVSYTTGHASLGLLAKYRYDLETWRTRLIVGADLDYSPGFRDEWRINAVRQGNVFTAYSKTAKLYDYDVTFMQASPYVHAETSPIERLRLTAGLRFDVMRYDYDTHLAPLDTGRARRPAGTTRDYTHLSPSLGATYALTPKIDLFANYKHAFRAPSEEQLFRQGSSNDTVHLAPVKVDSYEIGLRGKAGDDLKYELALYDMVKRDDILSVRDFSVGSTATNAGRTRHRGIEAAVDWRFLPEWRLGVAGSLAEHTYERWLSSEGDFSGKNIPMAPALTSTVTVGWTPAFLAGSRVEMEWQHLGRYAIDETNTAYYRGHDLLNARVAYDLSPSATVFGRVINLTDARWATTGAVNSRGQEEYAPGMSRTAIFGLTARF